MIYFKYNNKIYEVPNLEKKLKRMRLTLKDVEIINKPVKEESGKEDNGVVKYHYKHISGYSATSIYDNDQYLIEHGFTLDM